MNANDGGAATPDQPVASGERLVSLDFIRGISVLGILFANIVAFGHPMLAYAWPGALPGGGTAADGWLWLFQFVAIDGKFRGLFSILFGAGMYLFNQRCLARGSSGLSQVRRLLWLLLFGLLHFFLLFIGDILFVYALSGFAALAMLRWSARTQLGIGVAWYLTGSLLYASSLMPQAMLEQSPAARAGSSATWEIIENWWDERQAKAAEETAVITQGNYGDIVVFRAREQSGQIGNSWLSAVYETIPLILVGMALYRLGLLDDRGRRRRTLLWAWLGLAGGGIATLALGIWPLVLGFPPMLTEFVFHGLAAFPRLPMILGAAVLLARWTPIAAQGWLGERLIAAGRMAFSNYIATSLVMMLVFHGWAGGYYRALSRVDLLPIVALGWALMIAWSRPWLERYRYGPLEWLWRCLTYQKIFALRR